MGGNHAARLVWMSGGNALVMKLGATRRFRRRPEAIAAGREFVRRCLPSRGASDVADAVDDDAVDDLVLAASEAMNNVLEHASGLDFVVTVSVDGDQAGVVVTDAGTGFATPRRPAMPPADAVSHRGLALMHALVDRVRVTSTPAGTTVALAHRLAASSATAGSRRTGAAVAV